MSWNLPALQAVWGLEKKNISVFRLKVSLIEKVNPFGYEAYSKNNCRTFFNINDFFSSLI